MSPPRPTLDQLQVFLAIVEAGSFAGAARKLGRATSVVSYAIANLEAQLGLELFDRRATRKPTLTEAGRAILADTRTVAIGIDGLVAKARGLTAGLEAEVALAVDVMVPTQRLVTVLEAFQAEFPTVALRLHIEALGAVTQLVLDEAAGLGVSGPLLRTIDSIVRRQVGWIGLVPVAAPSHPLARLGTEVDEAAARNHVQLVLTDRSPLTRGQDFQVIGVKSWRLADLGAKHALLLAGLGWGSMPEEMVRDDLAGGRLVRLPLTGWQHVPYPLVLVHRTDRPPGPAGRWLMQRLETALAPADQPAQSLT